MFEAYWGYLHANGTLQIKRWYGLEDFTEANDSPYVEKACGPWECDSREEALGYLVRDLMMQGYELALTE